MLLPKQPAIQYLLKRRFGRAARSRDSFLFLSRSRGGAASEQNLVPRDVGEVTRFGHGLAGSLAQLRPQ